MEGTNSMGPRAKGFRFVKVFDEETVILDEEHAIAHQLNAEAAAVWLACDGSSDPSAIATKSGLSTDRVHEMLLQLQRLELLVPPEPTTSGQTRRHTLQKMAITGAGIAGLPAIVSLVLPTPAQAFASGMGGGGGGGGNGGTGGNGAAGGNGASGAPGSPGTSSPPPPSGVSGVGAVSQTSPGTPTLGHGAVGGVKQTSPAPHRSGVGAGKQTRPAPQGPSAPAGAGRSAAAGAGTSGKGIKVIGGSKGDLGATSGRSLPFTGFNVLSEALLGLAALAGGIGSRVMLRERSRKPE